MVRLKQLATLIATCATLVAAVPAASADVIHTYAVTLSISVDRAAGKLSGAISSDAPSEFCDSSTVRVRQAMPGKDKVVARVFPTNGEWRLKSFPAIRGKRVYAEVLTYELPQRPVMCLGAHSRAVTAP
ncbi:MAG TPA: hypothetical protein VNO20_10360 [Solirubrobacterales bacterium]|nr:hypothetical protein [Solirubrobacterales bacterium]